MTDTISNTSTVVFHILSQRCEKGEYFIGRDDIGSYIAVPPLGIEVIELLKTGLSVGRVKQVLHEKYEEEVEVDPFLEALIQLGFVKEINGHLLEDVFEKKKYWFTSIQPQHVGWLFSPPALVVYALLCASALLIMWHDHSYIPRYKDIFFHERFTVVILVAFGLNWLLVFKHEMAHLFAVKSLGLEGKFSLSNRLYFVVAETDMTQLWMRPRKDRYLPFLAGMISDVAVVSVLVIVLWLSDRGLSFNTGVYKVMKLVILMQCLGLLWQFQVFMRTDIYYVIATVLDCKNLFKDAQAYIKNVVFSRLGKSISSDVSEREMKAIKIYAVFLVLGTVWIFFIFFLYVMPITVQVLTGIYHNVAAGYRGNEQGFIDGIVFMSMVGFQWILLGVLVWKRRK